MLNWHPCPADTLAPTGTFAPNAGVLSNRAPPRHPRALQLRGHPPPGTLAPNASVLDMAMARSIECAVFA